MTLDKLESDTRNSVPLPETAYTQSSDSIYKPTRQLSTNSLSTLGLGIHTFHPRIKSSIIWIDDEYKELNTLKEVVPQVKKSQMFSLKGFCNLVTICFVLSLILFLIIFPFINK